MKYFLSSVVFVFFLILLSCDNGGGDLPSTKQKSKTFLQSDTQFKEFLIAEADKIFPEAGSEFNFIDGQLCRATSMVINDLPYELSSGTCIYNFEEPGYESFRVYGSTIINQELRLIIYVGFESMGIPETGTYYQKFICNDYGCFQHIHASAFLFDGHNDYLEEYTGNVGEIEVVNHQNKVTVTLSSASFTNYDETRGFNVSGNLSCCN